MILTITLNPLLEKVLFFEEVKREKVNRAIKYKINAGGKGINVSRQLNQFKLDNLATGFLGGENGKRLKQILYKEGIKNSFQTISDETREGFVIVEKSKILESYFSPDPFINSSEIQAFIEKTKKSILNCEMVIFCGSSPNFEYEKDEISVFSELIQYAKDNDKFVLIDVHGKILTELLKLKPDIIHTNLDELESSLSIELKTEKDQINFLQDYYKLGIKIFIITNEKNKFFVFNQGFIYEVIPPAIECVNSTGSGDAFMAGFIYGLHENLPFEEILKLSSAAGAANASMFEVCVSEFDYILKLKDQVIVNKLN